MIRAAATVLRHPSLWPTAARQWWRLTPRRWWRQRPYLPLPATDYRRFRMLTQYGDGDHQPSPDDVLNYLAWCHAQRAAR